jgi:hypothetical protein
MVLLTSPSYKERENTKQKVRKNFLLNFAYNVFTLWFLEIYERENFSHKLGELHSNP